MIRHKQFLTACLGLALLLALVTGAGVSLDGAEAQTRWGPDEEMTLVVIVNERVDLEAIPIEILSGIFLKNRKQYNGISLEPLNFTPEQPARLIFDGIVHNQSPRTAQRYWVEQSIKGISTPPLKESSTRALLSQARRYSTSITYLPHEEWQAGDYPSFRQLDVIPRDGNNVLGPEDSNYPLSGNLQKYVN